MSRRRSTNHLCNKLFPLRYTSFCFQRLIVTAQCARSSEEPSSTPSCYCDLYVLNITPIGRVPWLLRLRLCIFVSLGRRGGARLSLVGHFDYLQHKNSTVSFVILPHGILVSTGLCLRTVHQSSVSWQSYGSDMRYASVQLDMAHTQNGGVSPNWQHEAMPSHAYILRRSQ